VRKAVVFILGVVAIALLAVLYCCNPERHGFYPRCPLFALTGLQCAGCGTLRALYCILHGDFVRAFTFNPILVFALPLMLVLSIKREWCYNRYVGWGIVAVIIAYSIWRNF